MRKFPGMRKRRMAIGLWQQLNMPSMGISPDRKWI
jgi:hypothetical protein